MKTSIRALVATLAAASAISVQAANDGVVGSISSQGDVDVSLTINQAIVIKNLDDVDFQFEVDGTTTAGSNLVGRDTFCVGGTGFANSRYDIEFDSLTGTTGFFLGGTAQNLEYNLAFTTDTALGATGASVQTDGTMGGADFALTGNLACAEADDNAQLIVTIPSTSWENATETSYADTLYITVTGK